MVNALKKKSYFDLFVVMTDNETWVGKTHPKQALNQYRQQINKNARMCVLATTATGCSIADPNDPGMLDCVGFSNDTPQVISMFGRGEL
jgi:60 kDa SS-A/Ro ribonucleoprotein